MKRQGFVRKTGAFFAKKFRGKGKPAPQMQNAGPGPGTEELRWAMKQVGLQSKYFPELAKIHNGLLRDRALYPQGSIPKITGIEKLDKKLAQNMGQMHRLEKEINLLRFSVRKIDTIPEAEKVVRQVRGLEKQFNDLKAANFLIFLKFFKKGKKE